MRVKCKCGIEVERQRNIKNAICPTCLKKSIKEYHKTPQHKQYVSDYQKTEKSKKNRKKYYLKHLIETKRKLSEKVVFTADGMPTFNGIDRARNRIGRVLADKFKTGSKRIFLWDEWLNDSHLYKIHFMSYRYRLYEIWLKFDDKETAEKCYADICQKYYKFL